MAAAIQLTTSCATTALSLPLHWDHTWSILGKSLMPTQPYLFYLSHQFISPFLFSQCFVKIGPALPSATSEISLLTATPFNSTRLGSKSYLPKKVYSIWETVHTKQSLPLFT